ncbi:MULTISPECIES: hypothetical protein [Bradyrhizobium]|uniref:hypothetical protein n=1 Tax=Bradyrhizobium TaxID=374 RepID=UPI0009433F02|nr:MULTISPECIES: hypothetical protein [Bradyrhizobium]
MSTIDSRREQMFPTLAPREIDRIRRSGGPRPPEKDPWAMEFARTNMAGGGAFKLEKWAKPNAALFSFAIAQMRFRIEATQCTPGPSLERALAVVT